MAVHAPSPRLLETIPLTFVRERIRGGARKNVDTQVTLVPFIDLLICLVVFLLANFGDQIVAQSEDMRLPDGVNTVRIAEAPVIEINRHRVSLDGREVTSTEGLTADASISRIEPLVRDLETTAHNWTILHPGEELPHAVIIQADANTDYRVIKKVLFSAAQAGFGNISFAVNDVGS